jgi:hypothetical protein
MPEAGKSDPQPLPNEPAPPPRRGRSPLRIAGWATSAVGAGLLLGGLITGTMALSLNKDLKYACEDGCPEGKASALDSMNSLALTTDVLLPVGATVVVAGIVMLGIASSRDDLQGDVSFGTHFSIGRASVSFAKRF